MNFAKALLCLVALVFACAVAVQADGPQPCKYIRLKQGGTEAECMSCCEKEGLVKGVSFDACRCITKPGDY